MSEISESVNRIIAHFIQAKKAYEGRDLRERAIEMARYEQELKGILAEYERMETLTRPIPVMDGDDLSDLPPEILSELSVAKTDELEDQIVTIMNAAGGEVDIDAILIHLFRRFEVKQTRRYLQNKLWRMTQKGYIHSVSGKKGRYSVQPSPSDDEPESSHEEDTVIIDIDDDDSIPF